MYIVNTGDDSPICYEFAIVAFNDLFSHTNILVILIRTEARLVRLVGYFQNPRTQTSVPPRTDTNTVHMWPCA